jgi:hypothetical protein
LFVVHVYIAASAKMSSTVDAAAVKNILNGYKTETEKKIDELADLIKKEAAMNSGHHKVQAVTEKAAIMWNILLPAFENLKHHIDFYETKFGKYNPEEVLKQIGRESHEGSKQHPRHEVLEEYKRILGKSHFAALVWMYISEGYTEEKPHADKRAEDAAKAAKAEPEDKNDAKAEAKKDAKAEAKKDSKPEASENADPRAAADNLVRRGMNGVGKLAKSLLPGGQLDANHQENARAVANSQGQVVTKPQPTASANAKGQPNEAARQAAEQRAKDEKNRGKPKQQVPDQAVAAEGGVKAKEAAQPAVEKNSPEAAAKADAAVNLAMEELFKSRP